MNYFLFSFLAGGLLTLIPKSRGFLMLLQRVFYGGFIEPWRMFVLWGLIFSVLFFVSKSQVEQYGFLKFWRFAGILALLIILFVLFASSYAF